MRIAIAGLLHETNTFADGLTDYAAFEHKGAFPGLLKDQEILQTLRGVAMCAGGYIAVAEKSGMDLVPLIWSGPVENYPQIEEFTLQPSPFTTKEPREGIYIKVSKDNRWITHRFKMVRHGFVQGKLWSKDALQKNSLARS